MLSTTALNSVAPASKTLDADLETDEDGSDEADETDDEALFDDFAGADTSDPIISRDISGQNPSGRTTCLSNLLPSMQRGYGSGAIPCRLCDLPMAYSASIVTGRHRLLVS
ncbi:hypothetical protein N7495_005776 [Penicillium taxi]|uniref:uncharacterized protein n=1 Tax=Penicillium taxi TaxID=168475 RepID=UPI0025455190|nr:uncharacterized protein N7495_005776 [Penicillium taxi]KAJ5894085.1 hypothetical protein N7495_005776 [Penicillium taxi]